MTGAPGGVLEVTGAPGGLLEVTGAPGGLLEVTGAPVGVLELTGAPGGVLPDGQPVLLFQGPEVSYQLRQVEGRVLHSLSGRNMIHLGEIRGLGSTP